MNLGGRLKECRQLLGLTQQSMAVKLGTSSGYISEIEAGKKTPGSDLLTSLRREFDVDINWLLTGEGPRRREDILGIAGPQAKGLVYDQDVMTKVVQVVEELIDAEGLSIAPAKKARLVTLLYEDVMEKRVVSEEITARVHSLLGLAT